MNALTKQQLESLRGLLEAECDSLEEGLVGHGRVQGEGGDWQGNSSGLSGIEADPTDVADQIEELVTNVPLVEELEARHRDVVSAIERIEAGTYGMCEVSKEHIPFARLEANPAARTCIKHAT